MTNPNKSFYFDGVKVYKTKDKEKGNVYLVKLEDEECSFCIKQELADNASCKWDVEPQLVAILLAYIKYSKVGAKGKRIEDEDILIRLPILLTRYSIETLINLIRPLKWHEINEILSSTDPIRKIEEFM